MFSVTKAVVLACLSGALAFAQVSNFVAPLSGDQEVPVRDTKARGVGIFQLSADGTELRYTLIVANIRNVVAAHIHLAAAGVNGSVVAFLAGNFPPGGGPSNGVLASGTITAANLVGPLVGHPLSDLVTPMGTGGAYVNVHTNDGVAPVNTGPGDFPAARFAVRSSAPHRP